MSINHYSSSLDLPETTLWWTHQNPQHQQQQQNIQIMEPIPNPSWPLHHHKNLFNLNNNNNNNEEDEEFQDQVQQDEQATSSQEQDEEQQQEEEEKEPMFEKPLTPSDVGKLNRLVIPKQHAEKYFPLGAASAAPAVTSTTASDSGECKGLLLSFEDESGKCWRFRYSYWNSSQSYVLTKGWSRYVKDKRLDAGDIVSFERHRSDSQRLFIRWRRRSADAAATAAQVSRAGHGGGDGSNNGKSGGGAGGVGWTSGFYCAQPSYPTHHQQQQHQLAYQQHEDLHAGKVSQVLNQRTRPILRNCSSSNSKVLRLFGVNMECQTQQDDDEDDDSTTPQCSYNNVVMPSTHAANNNNNNTNHQNLYHINQPPNSHMLHQQPFYY